MGRYGRNEGTRERGLNEDWTQAGTQDHTEERSMSTREHGL
jgi:hypothetical protein